jgi:hypothetical protein
MLTYAIKCIYGYLLYKRLCVVIGVLLGVYMNEAQKVAVKEVESMSSQGAYFGLQV